jgi:hypothetical protein
MTLPLGGNFTNRLRIGRLTNVLLGGLSKSLTVHIKNLGVEITLICLDGQHKMDAKCAGDPINII